MEGSKNNELKGEFGVQSTALLVRIEAKLTSLLIGFSALIRT